MITSLFLSIKRGYDALERKDAAKPAQKGQLIRNFYANDDVSPGRPCAYHAIAAYTYVSYSQSTSKGLVYGPWETIEAHKYKFYSDK